MRWRSTKACPTNWCKWLSRSWTVCPLYSLRESLPCAYGQFLRLCTSHLLWGWLFVLQEGHGRLIPISLKGFLERYRAYNKVLYFQKFWGSEPKEEKNMFCKIKYQVLSGDSNFWVLETCIALSWPAWFLQRLCGEQVEVRLLWRVSFERTKSLTWGTAET